MVRFSSSCVLLATSLLLFSATTFVDAFSTSTGVITSRTNAAVSTTQRWGKKGKKNFDDEDAMPDPTLAQIEAARFKFEALMRSDSGTIGPPVVPDGVAFGHQNPHHNPPARVFGMPHRANGMGPQDMYRPWQESCKPSRMTTGERKRRMLEIELLESLVDSDDAIDEMVAMWMTERGHIPAKDLEEMQHSCSPGLVREEQVLRDMVQWSEYQWVEPILRLSMLLYYKGKSEESFELCESVLKQKPWHFEAAHLMLLHSITRSSQLAHKVPSRWMLARKFVLPRLNKRTNNKRRREWVRRMVKEAKTNFRKAEGYMRFSEQEREGFLE